MEEHVDLSGSSGLVRAGREPDMTRLAEELVASATERGIALTGDGGLLTALTRQVLQSALEAEMAAHATHTAVSAAADTITADRGVIDRAGGFFLLRR